MKAYGQVLSGLVLLGTLAGCGGEKFGSTPQSSTSTPDGLRYYDQLSCSSSTLIKPKVDILYVVDNSTSSYYLAGDIKTAIRNTVDSISKEFDYRMVGTTLIPGANDANPYDDYQVMTNSSDALSAEATNRKIISSSELTFFTNPAGGSEEAGLRRAIDFMSNHTSDNLFRQNAYHLVVLVSNGRDNDVEYDLGYGNGETGVRADVFNARLASLKAIDASLNPAPNTQKLRLFTVTAKSACKTGWLPSVKSYVKMANEMYTYSEASDNNAKKDSYDLCETGISSLFATVNSSIKQVVISHKYRYWPITFTNDAIDTSKIKVYKTTAANSAPVLLTSGWQYKLNPNYPNDFDTRYFPSSGEPTRARHLIEFLPGHEISYPTCVSVTSTSKTEYFNYVVLPKEPKPQTLAMQINGRAISSSATDGFTYVGYKTNQNVKVAYPNAGDDQPAIIKSGFMLQLNGSANYYKSGDKVDVNYIPAGI